jgi:hypothetical protein
VDDVFKALLGKLTRAKQELAARRRRKEQVMQGEANFDDLFFVACREGFFTGEGFSLDHQQAVAYPDAGACLAAADEATKKTGERCVAWLVPGPGPAGIVESLFNCD